ncbi:Kinesin-like protein KIF11 [Hondaea fermentalgiana]|uniref:Kinesin-like protein KIF11 n=1 Tax=Hondaea fermentalgiana TaxID=2315210 RepID=A0A2R5GEC2_9STRA|nr:Kinesin-like protein KIF11 [Hondaea fermentalgiana]|eukprot:GBG28905.1 Kinesin-like protein KIF11 [Hondaea fermentalgiana]
MQHQQQQGGSREDNIKVVVRSRPLNAAEKAAKTPSLVQCDADRGQVSVSMAIGSKRSSKKYNYDMVFGPYSTQAEVYSSAIRPVVDEVLQGYNCTVFAYGQTGTGKTFTMEGNVDDPELQGMIPRAVDSIFQRLEAIDDAEYTIKVSFLELYNEELQDLLSVTDEKRLRILDDKSRMGTGVSCHNLEEIMVKNTDEIFEVMRTAMAKRATGETKLNKNSSRSHSIFTLTLHIRETTPEGEDLLKVGKLNLVDLAGSECIGRSGAQNARAREAGNINKSLLTLGRVISALVEKTPHIPYRDSKLTRLLQESLGGRAKTCIIATVAPSVQCLDETLSTLEYASRAKTIKNKPEANQRMTKRTLIKEYAEDLERLRQELSAARAKDGVYLAEDRFNEMTMQIESQSTQIEELEDALEHRQKELSELKDLFEETSSKLEDTSAKLEDTEQELGQTKTELTETKDELQTQVTLVEETRVLVGAHQDTEAKLQERTRELHTVLDEAKGDIENLHAKVQRKTDLEAKNMNASRRYQDSTLDALTGVSREAASFCERQLHHHAALASAVRDLRASHKSQIEAVVEAVNRLGGHANENLAAVSSQAVPALRDAAKADWKRAEDQANAHLDDANSGLEIARIEATAPLTAVLEDVLVRQQNELDRHASVVADRLAASVSDIEGFAVKQTASLDALSQRIATDAQNGRRALEAQTTSVGNFVSAERARLESASDALMQQFATMLTAFRTEAQTNLDNMLSATKDACRNSVETIARAETQTKQEVQAVSSAMQTWCSSSAEANKALKQSVEADAEALRGVAAEVREKTADAASRLATHTGAMLELTKVGHAQAASIRAEATATLDAQSANVQSQVAQYQEIVKEDQNMAVESVQAPATAVDSWTNAAEASANGNSEALSAHFGDARNRVEGLTKSCNQYVNEELLRDEPTSTTPSKKPYAYASDIPATASHDEILAAHRIAKKERQDAFCDDEDQHQHMEAQSPSRMSASSRSGEENENKTAESPASRPETEGTARTELGEISSRVVNQRREQTSSKTSIPFPGGKSPESAQGSLASEESENKDHETEEARLSMDTIMSMKVSQLRKELSALGLSQLGKKDTLQQRLIDAVEAQLD